MRTYFLSALLALLFTSCDAEISIKVPLAAYRNDLAFRMLACDYLVNCRDEACAIKWRCPQWMKDR